jgi:prepilin-type N-terminal cleavage/methylation domain-containing protein
MKTMKINRKGGFTLVEIMIVVAIIGLLAAIAIPNFIKARATSQTNACINNLRQIDSAKQQWALETHQNSTATPGSTDIQGYLGRGAGGSLTSVVCPADTSKTFAKSYTINDTSIAPTCNIDGTAGSGTHVLLN